MPISVLSNIDYRGQLHNFTRDGFDTISDMVNYNENYLPDIFEAFCSEDGNKYRYKRNNEVDPTTGKWRVVTEGGIQELPKASVTTLGGVKIGDGISVDSNGVISADEQTEENFTTELKTKLDDIDLDNYVEKETGKGLSTNDLTDELKEKYDKAEENVQSDWTQTDEAADDFIKGKPTKVSDFDNDSEFITKAVTDLTNYYTKTDTYTQEEVNSLVNAINSFTLKKVTELPTDDINTHCIYFVPHGSTEGNLFDEYIYIDEKWENLGPAVLPSSGRADEVTYENDAHSDWDNVQKALDGILAIVEYVDPKVNSFTMTPSTDTYEVGQSVASLDFAWAYNKAVTTQSLTDATLELADRSATITGPFTTNKTFTLNCGDGKKTATASKSISFKNKIYWGSAAIPETYDSDFILGLSNKQFATAKKGTYSFTVATGEYAFIAYPKSFGILSNWYVGGFETTVESCGTVSFTNASGGVADYYIYRSGRSGLGSISAEIK